MIRRRRAFTLVELLVVVAIIAIIMSLLLPALRNARLSAQSGRCLSNLHQVALAANMYTMENRGDLPPHSVYRFEVPASLQVPDPVNGGFYSPNAYRRLWLITEWFLSGPYPSAPRAGDGAFGPYMNTGIGIDPYAQPGSDGTYGGMHFIPGCPSEPVGPTPKQLKVHYNATYEFWTYRAFSYGVNLGAATPGWPEYPGVFTTDKGTSDGAEMTDLPGNLVLMADGPGRSPSIFGPWPTYVETDEYTGYSPTRRHVNSFDAAFVDGHSKNGSHDKLWTTEYWLRNFPFD